ncbi:MAG: glycosyltransferase family 4 protein [Clostridiales bacterium]|nr:glycosyltransferase family 4 protein [Clostridiales bacterium]
MKILFIACYSPFINNSAAIETLQYLNKLSEIKDNEVFLLTVDFPKNSVYYDEELSKLINKNVKIYPVKGGKIFTRFVPRISEEKTNNRTLNTFKMLKNIKNALVIPDMYYGWSNNASIVGREIVKKEKIDVIFSMHEPPSSHLCAYKIKKIYSNIPWITYWSDPWLKDSTREESFLIKKLIEKKMEKEVVINSDRFIFVTEANRNDYINSYNIDPDKTFIITRGYDKKLFTRLSGSEKPELINNDKINIIYAGEIFTKLRDITPFINAVKEVRKNNIDLYNKLNILFFGNIDDIEVKRELESLSICKVNRRIPFEEAIKYVLNSEVLLLFGNKNSKQIPAKIYEYFGASGRIFVIYGDENDPLKELVENNERCITSLNNSEKIYEHLTNLLSINKEEYFSKPDERYEWGNIVEKLNNILEV